MCRLSTEFCENRLSSFRVILLTNKLTNADENITSLAEVIGVSHTQYIYAINNNFVKMIVWNKINVCNVCMYDYHDWHLSV